MQIYLMTIYKYIWICDRFPRLIKSPPYQYRNSIDHSSEAHDDKNVFLSGWDKIISVKYFVGFEKKIFFMLML